MPPVTWRRSDHFPRLLAEPDYDVLVVGGGVIGCGVALDLAQRGFSVALVERNDFASGTSGRSTKLFHGGIRYLPHFRFQLVAEGLREQRVLAEIADYLFRPLEFLVPVYEQYGLADAPAWASTGRRATLALGAGLAVYDLLGGLDRPGDRHERLSLEEVTELAPSLRTDGLRGGFTYWDAQTDDARLVVALARTAVSLGAVAVNRTAATGASPTGGEFVVEVVDGVTGEKSSIKARTVVSATGAYDPLQLGEAPPLQLTLSKGAHVLVEPEAVGLLDQAIVLPKTDDGRVMFIIPWSGRALIGTTDTEYRGAPEQPVAGAEDVDYLIAHVERYFSVNGLVPLASFAGLRALGEDEDGSTASASREHVINEPVPGFWQVAGGKLTTYRRIASGIADRVTRHLGSKAKSGSAETRLIGAGAEASEPLELRYGTEAGAVPTGTMLLSDEKTYLAEAGHTARYESVVSIGDFALRRTRLALLSPTHGRVDSEAIAKALGEELGWSEDERRRQLLDFETELLAEGL